MAAHSTPAGVAPRTIAAFRGKYAFLSNFHRCAVTLDGVTYGSSEAAFQAAKCDDDGYRARLAGLKTPAAAKRAGSRAGFAKAGLTLRPDWDDIRVDAMRDVLDAKFRQHPELGNKLCATGNAVLQEGNTWGDAFWGVTKTGGKNWLGQCLMELRSVLQAEAAQEKTVDEAVPGRGTKRARETDEKHQVVQTARQ